MAEPDRTGKVTQINIKVVVNIALRWKSYRHGNDSRIERACIRFLLFCCDLLAECKRHQLN